MAFSNDRTHWVSVNSRAHYHFFLVEELSGRMLRLFRLEYPWSGEERVVALIVPHLVDTYYTSAPILYLYIHEISQLEPETRIMNYTVIEYVNVRRYYLTPSITHWSK